MVEHDKQCRQSLEETKNESNTMAKSKRTSENSSESSFEANQP